MLFRLGLKVFQINVTIFRRFDWHDFPADHLRRCRVCAMGTHWDEADVAMPLALRAVISGNCQKPGIFTLRARIRLHRNRIIAGDLAKLRTQIVDHFAIP